MDHYAWNENCCVDSIEIAERAIPLNLSNDDPQLAAWNCANIADLYAELGLLHWRRGLDPRVDFDKTISAFNRMRSIVDEHGISLAGNMARVYAVMALRGAEAEVKFIDHLNHTMARWPCYECCLAHALQGQPLDEDHSATLERHLGENHALLDRSFLTYFQILGLKSSERPLDALAATANDNWSRRRTTKFFENSDTCNGFGVMNDLYVDLYLAAGLHKVGWEGEGIHVWRWGTR